jgi:hypothetical protein
MARVTTNMTQWLGVERLGDQIGERKKEENRRRNRKKESGWCKGVCLV